MRRANVERTTLTPPVAAARLGISLDKIHRFIHSGELRAVDLSGRRGGRPRYVIMQVDLDAFIASRAVVPATPCARRPRRSDDMPEYV